MGPRSFWGLHYTGGWARDRPTLALSTHHHRIDASGNGSGVEPKVHPVSAGEEERWKALGSRGVIKWVFLGSTVPARTVPHEQTHPLPTCFKRNNLGREKHP